MQTPNEETSQAMVEPIVSLLPCCDVVKDALRALGFYEPNDWEDWMQWESPDGSNVDLGFRTDTAVVVLWSQVVPITTVSDIKELIRLVSG